MKMRYGSSKGVVDFYQGVNCRLHEQRHNFPGVPRRVPLASQHIAQTPSADEFSLLIKGLLESGVNRSF